MLKALEAVYEFVFSDLRNNYIIMEIAHTGLPIGRQA